jgi:hypothetical protein
LSRPRPAASTLAEATTRKAQILWRTLVWMRLVMFISSATGPLWIIRSAMNSARRRRPRRTPQPGYDKEGNRLTGKQVISPRPEGSTWGWRTLLNNTKFIVRCRDYACANYFLARTLRYTLIDQAVQSFGANSASNFSKRGSFRSGSQYRSS